MHQPIQFHLSRRSFGISLLAPMLATPAAAADYPARPIKLIVPFTPGGLADTGARIVAEKMTRLLGQTMVVENRPGAGGNIGTGAVASAAPDGYTLLLGFDGTLLINPHVYSKVPFDAMRDFVSIGKIGDAAGVIVVHPSVQAKTLRQLIDLSKASPKGLDYGSSGVGGTSHLVAEMLNARSGAKFVHVPYKGGGQAMADVVSGVLPINFTAVAGAYPFVKQGQLRAVALFSPQRVASMPDVPTLAEAGYPEVDANSWISLMAPAKTTPQIEERLTDALRKALAMPDVKERFETLGLFPSSQTKAQFEAQNQKDYRRYGEIVNALNIRID